ncbi:MAG: hypothetical protein UW04_C0001G0017 [Parcubacteria group bacterium GW2011_GWB1_43_8]|nr:MAG: hypothetical protein UW04_C0001G0017 [Parcubacteria group bacterium GW2011_GWB1_43_8]
MRKYRQCSICGKIRVRRGRWILPLKAIVQKGVKPDKVIRISECPKCRDTITFNIITNAVPAVSQT